MHTEKKKQEQNFFFFKYSDSRKKKLKNYTKKISDELNFLHFYIMFSY